MRARTTCRKRILIAQLKKGQGSLRKENKCRKSVMKDMDQVELRL